MEGLDRSDGSGVTSSAKGTSSTHGTKSGVRRSVVTLGFVIGAKATEGVGFVLVSKRCKLSRLGSFLGSHGSGKSRSLSLIGNTKASSFIASNDTTECALDNNGSRDLLQGQSALALFLVLLGLQSALALFFLLLQRQQALLFGDSPSLFHSKASLADMVKTV